MAGGDHAWLRLDGPWLEVVDAAYAPADDFNAWVHNLGAATRGIFKCLPLTVHLATHAPDGTFEGIRAFWSTLAPELLAEGLRMVPAFTRDMVRIFYYPPGMVATHAERRAQVTDRLRTNLESYVAAAGLSDSVGVVVHPEPGVVLVIQAAIPAGQALDPNARRYLTWLGLHVEAALRLHLRSHEPVRAVVGASGRVEHLEPGAPTKDGLERAVQSVQQARRRRRDGAAALGLWRALVDGELSVVERTIGSRSYYYFIDNPPHRQPFHALSAREQDAVSAICNAPSNKVAAYALGISEGALSQRLAAASGKLGMASRMDLVRIAAMLTRDPRARFEDSTLSASEKAVLELLSHGLSNAEIAKIRARSARTIANQVASLLRKTGAAGRRDLVIKTTR